jgi:hypothetical protein
VELPQQHKHQCFLGEQEQRQQRRAKGQQPKRDPASAQQVREHGDPEGLGAHSQHLLGLAHSEQAVSPPVCARAIKHADHDKRQQQRSEAQRSRAILKIWPNHPEQPAAEENSQRDDREIGQGLAEDEPRPQARRGFHPLLLACDRQLQHP